MRIRRLPGAIDAARSIWRYIAKDDVAAADRLAERLIVATARLADHPLSGSPRPEIHPDAFSIPVGAYTIYYRIGEHTVDVVTIRHSAQDQSAIGKAFD